MGDFNGSFDKEVWCYHEEQKNLQNSRIKVVIIDYAQSVTNFVVEHTSVTWVGRCQTHLGYLGWERSNTPQLLMWDADTSRHTSHSSNKEIIRLLLPMRAIITKVNEFLRLLMKKRI